MGNQTQVRATSDGIDLQHTTSDSPFLPVGHLEQLKQIDPSLIPFIVDQTRLEADFRRSEHRRTNRFIFTERISAVLSATIVAIVGLSWGGYCIISGHDTAGAAICGVTLLGMVGAFLKVVSNKQENNKPPPTKRTRKK